MSTAAHSQSSTSESFHIRPAQADDVTKILDFIRGLADYEKLSHEVVATEESLRRSLFGDRPYAEVIFACEGDREVGFALFFHNFSTFLGRPGIYLEDLFIAPDDRGKGYGKALLTHLARIAVERQCGRLEWAVLDWNTPAIRFYESLGAQAMDEWQIFRLTGDALQKLGSS